MLICAGGFNCGSVNEKSMLLESWLVVETSFCVCNVTKTLVLFKIGNFI
jgi:hypothetical protein